MILTGLRGRYFLLNTVKLRSSIPIPVLETSWELQSIFVRSNDRTSSVESHSKQTPQSSHSRVGFHPAPSRCCHVLSYPCSSEKQWWNNEDSRTDKYIFHIMTRFGFMVDIQREWVVPAAN